VRRRPITLLLGSAVAIAAASPAAAAEVAVRGLDTQVFDKPAINVEVGDKVTWTFDATLPHDVTATSDNWKPFASVPALPAPPVEFTFTAPGTYTYFCSVHSSTMLGTVTVGTPPPPPPPPLSEQPFPNDGTIPLPDGGTTGADAFEIGGVDTTDPRLRRVAAKRSGKRVRVSFRVNEQSVVTVRFTRGRKIVKTKRAATAGRGTVTVAGLKAGRYSVKLVATDPAGNDSSTRRASFRIR
jgi:plastocyanin